MVPTPRQYVVALTAVPDEASRPRVSFLRLLIPAMLLLLRPIEARCNQSFVPVLLGFLGRQIPCGNVRKERDADVAQLTADWIFTPWTMNCRPSVFCDPHSISPHRYVIRSNVEIVPAHFEVRLDISTFGMLST